MAKFAIVQGGALVSLGQVSDKLDAQNNLIRVRPAGSVLVDALEYELLLSEDPATIAAIIARAA